VPKVGLDDAFAGRCPVKGQGDVPTLRCNEYLQKLAKSLKPLTFLTLLAKW
jgi:hypothetical protein